MDMADHGFDANFEALTGHRPFPWQRRAFESMSRGELPESVDVPTGLGKTAVMAVWLLARAECAALPRRLVYVVDRRAVVDQATEFAETLRCKLNGDGLRRVRRALGLEHGQRLPISTLRGQHADNREWMEDPSAPAIIVGTVDMIGSRLLFEGYGLSRRMRPYAAGLLGCDTLVMLDEAHLSRPFERLLLAIEKGRRACPAGGGESAHGVFAGPAASPGLPPPFRVVPLSATLGGGAESGRLRLCAEDRENPIVRRRLHADKVLTVTDLAEKADLAQELAERACSLAQEECEKRGGSVRILVYCNSRDSAEKVKKALDKLNKDVTPRRETILFVGARRVRERQQAAQKLREHGFIAGSGASGAAAFLVATSAGEVGVDLDAGHMVCDLVPWERMVQRLGRVNRRGTGRARIAVVDQGPRGEGDSARHEAVRELIDSLPPVAEAEGRQASPAALAALGERPESRDSIMPASTPPPLYPALSRPLVDAWSMTSLVEHTGRPEVGPWLRGWIDEEPQTTVIWRRYLPVRFETEHDRPKLANRGEIDAFFEAAPPERVESLETETRHVADWLIGRAREIERDACENGDDREEEYVVDNSIAPMHPYGPMGLLIEGSNEQDDNCVLTLTNLLSISKKSRPEKKKEKKKLERSLSGRILAVDARFGGLKEGLLDASSKGPVPTVEDHWGDSGDEAWEESGLTTRVRIARDDEDAAPAPPWRQVFRAPYRVSPEGEPVTSLVVEKRGRGVGGEDARAITSRSQSLEEHRAWVACEAERIADRIGLCPADRAMLVSAARRHDDGKAAARWQRAFNAESEGGPYAKTAGPVDRWELAGFRHEFKSAIDAERDGLDGVARSDPRFDLALHAIAAHHGHARPVIGVEGCDDMPPSAAEREAYEIARRFARLQRLWGPWGLAWWEALLRAADQRASRRLDGGDMGESVRVAPRAASGSTGQDDLFGVGKTESS